MSESRICPVCEKEIPEDARFLCPHCHFELKWLDEEEAIQKARQNFTGELFTDGDSSEMGSRSNESNQLNGKYYVSGGVVSFIVGVILSLMWVDAGLTPIYSIFALPGGLLAAYIGTRLEKKFTNAPALHKIGFVFLCVILSIISHTLILFSRFLV